MMKNKIFFYLITTVSLIFIGVVLFVPVYANDDLLFKYRLKKGDTLEGIAVLYTGKIENYEILKDINPGDKVEGDTILIPRELVIGSEKVVNLSGGAKTKNLAEAVVDGKVENTSVVEKSTGTASSLSKKVVITDVAPNTSVLEPIDFDEKKKEALSSSSSVSPQQKSVQIPIKELVEDIEINSKQKVEIIESQESEEKIRERLLNELLLD